MQTRIQGSIQRQDRAFSLVEMLVVIAVIGIIVAISVPVIGSVIAKSKKSVTQRTAQVLASTASASLVAGAPTVATASDESEILDILSTGVLGTGQFADVAFRVPLSAEEKAAVDAYLVFEGGRLLYDPSGSSGG